MNDAHLGQQQLEAVIRNDVLLIYFVGKHIHSLASNSKVSDESDETKWQVSKTRLNKVAAAVMRHWSLFSDNQYGDTCWNLKHGPFRHGQVVYFPTKVIPSSHPFRITFVPDLLQGKYSDPTARLYQKLLGSLGITYKTHLEYLYANSYELTKIKRNAYFSLEDIDKIDQLAQLYAFYANGSRKSAYALATCPTDLDTFNATNAEINIWLYDIEKIFRLLSDDVVDKASPLLRYENQINRRLQAAFKCAEEARVKQTWLGEARSAAFRLDELAIETKIDAYLPALHPKYQSEITKHVDNREIFEISDIMRGFTVLVCQSLKDIHSHIDLPENDLEKNEHFVHDFIVPRFITTEQYEELRFGPTESVNSSELGEQTLPENLIILNDTFHRIRQFLRESGRPHNPDINYLNKTGSSV